jgi:hypothetical protein
MTTSFSGGRSRSTRREPPTLDKQLVNFITCGCESSPYNPQIKHIPDNTVAVITIATCCNININNDPYTVPLSILSLRLSYFRHRWHWLILVILFRPNGFYRWHWLILVILFRPNGFYRWHWLILVILFRPNGFYSWHKNLNIKCNAHDLFME